LNFSLYIAKRYLFTKSSQNAINIINFITAAVVVVGALALFIVLAGFAGLKTFSLSFSNAFDPDIKAVAATGKVFDISLEQENELSALEGVIQYSKVLEERVFLNYNNKNYTPFLKGVDTNFNKVTGIDSIIRLGSWLQPDQNEVVVGQTIASQLGIVINDYSDLLEIIVPKLGKASISSLQEARPYYNKLVVPVGMFNIDVENNGKYVFSDLQLAQNLLKLKENQVSGVEFKITSEADEEILKTQIGRILGANVIVKNRAELNDSLYKMLNTENIAIYLIFTLILIIALFNVVGSTIMTILDKKGNLKTLFSMGATVKQIRRIFFMQGTLLSIFGGLLGIVIGSIIVGLQMTFGLIAVPGTNLPYPMELRLENYLIVFVTITVLGVIASKIASSAVGKKLIET